ncbi:hypothetical protein HK107_01410 [Parvularcula sp. ZS-1/3]|uniref:Transmembrane protein n=1 Tax=Parvularcula mediterranea TaxID=2732508 RepID=A0A7Y3RJ28_9PROT|nr:hypothetical protein [Parvularcula mediterranea]NNU14980.1 hypothetical protein [Parvularcula mediterranea]
MSSANATGTLRKFVLMIGASAFLTVQFWLQDTDWSGGGEITTLAAIGMALWAALLLFMMGPWLWSRATEDERTELTRHRAFFFGYFAMVLTGLAMFGLAIAGRVEAAEAIHLTLALGIAVPIYGFAFLE